MLQFKVNWTQGTITHGKPNEYGLELRTPVEPTDRIDRADILYTLMSTGEMGLLMITGPSELKSYLYRLALSSTAHIAIPIDDILVATRAVREDAKEKASILPMSAKDVKEESTIDDVKGELVQTQFIAGV
jgi:hypothetical protein